MLPRESPARTRVTAARSYPERAFRPSTVPSDHYYESLGYQTYARHRIGILETALFHIGSLVEDISLRASHVIKPKTPKPLENAHNMHAVAVPGKDNCRKRQ